MTQRISGLWSHSWASATACIAYFSGCCDQMFDEISLSQERFTLGHGLRGSSLSQQGRRNSQSCDGGLCGAACSLLRKQSAWARSSARLQCSKPLTPQPTSCIPPFFCLEVSIAFMNSTTSWRSRVHTCEPVGDKVTLHMNVSGTSEQGGWVFDEYVSYFYAMV